MQFSNNIFKTSFIDLCMYTQQFLGDLIIHYDLYLILSMMNKFVMLMEWKTNFFLTVDVSMFLLEAK